MNRLIKGHLANISIRRKLMFLIMSTCGVLLVATTVVFVLKETYSLIGEQKKNLTSLADILSKNVTAALTFNDPQSALDTMNSLSVKNDILAAYILENDATIFSRYLAKRAKLDSLPFEQLLPDDSPEIAQKLLAEISLRSNQLFQQPDQLSFVSPILLDGQKIGTVVLFADMHELWARLAGALLAAALILCLAAIAAYLLSARLQGIISGPILRLADTMRRVSESKDFSLRASKPGDDEIGSLYDGFNEMLGEIEERNLVLRQRQEHLQELAHFDHLTRLPNRVLFYDRLQQAIKLALRNEQKIAVMFLDLDRFKDVNDTLGHRTGDMLLQQVAERMRLLLRDCDTVARLGGDEFTVFSQNVMSIKNACKVAQKILDMFEPPFVLEGQEVYVTCSIGVTVFPDDCDEVDTLLMNADIAMYHAKSDGKNTYRIYNVEMNLQANERVALQADLRRAVELKQLYLQY